VLEFYGEGFLAPCPTPKFEDHPLSSVHNCTKFYSDNLKRIEHLLDRGNDGKNIKMEVKIGRDDRD
jgi:hypothetical protein